MLNGSLDTISKHKPTLVLELLRKWSSQFDYTPNDVIDLLDSLGYFCFAISDILLRVNRIDDDTIETNFLFVHKNNTAHFAALGISV